MSKGTKVELQAGRWWQVLASDGSVWCETSVEREARTAMRAGDTLRRWYAPPRDFGEWREVCERVR